MKKASITFLLAVSLIFISGCDNSKAFVAYKPPLLPMTVSIDSNGEISFSFDMAVSYPTFIGTFSAGVSWSPMKDFNVPSILIVRVDDRKDYIYDLKEQDFSISFESGYYEKVKISKNELTPANSKNPETVLLLEVKRKDTEVYQPLYTEPAVEPQAPITGNAPSPAISISNYRCESQFSGSMLIRLQWSAPYDTSESDISVYQVVVNRQGYSGEYDYKVSSGYGGHSKYSDVNIPCAEGKYQWMVRAVYNSGNYSEWSWPVNFTISK